MREETERKQREQEEKRKRLEEAEKKRQALMKGTMVSRRNRCLLFVQVPPSYSRFMFPKCPFFTLSVPQVPLPTFF